ncbi:MAG: threonine--tRNA ligase, partial [Desulfobulbaceae bacterium]|nr:threonine--tRNA ligase [Desulfobulbaceae bacterium]
MTERTLTLPGGEKKTVLAPITVAEALKDLVSNRERKQIVAVRLDGKAVDLSSPIEADALFVPIVMDSQEGLEILRHSAAHVLAEAVLALFGREVKVAIGPAIADGFYYDFDRPEPFTPDDFQRIEAKMQEIVASAAPFSRETLSLAEAMDLFSRSGQPYKVELLQEIKEDTVTVYRQGDFVDLCRGPHLPHAGWLKAFKIVKLAGAYWRGDEKRQMLQRIYGTAFFDAKDL